MSSTNNATSRNKKYKIITTIEDDAPFSNINWYTISFLTPQKIDSLKYLDVKGFKVHNGYNTEELGNSDAKEIKKKFPNHDVYLSQMGKNYAWDDATRTDDIEYDNEKLNNLEKTRRENIDKYKLMREQFANERFVPPPNANTERMDAQKNRIRKRLYEKGIITQKEYDMILQENKPVKDIKEMALAMEKMNTEMEECFKTDYLEENESTGLKYGCITFYSPKHIGGLQTLCFKIRGLFQTVSEMKQRIRQLRKLYPNDRIYSFEVGKWCPYSENDSIEPTLLIKQLNYSMKCHLDNLVTEEEEFKKRTETMQSKAAKEGAIQKSKNRREKRRAKRKAAKGADTTHETTHETTQETTHDTNQTNMRQESNDMPPSLGNEDDDVMIKQILNFLEDPETNNKFAADKASIQTSEINVN